MTQPVRIQLSRRKGFRLQEHSLALNGLHAVKVDRTTRWGNPFRVTDLLEELTDEAEKHGAPLPTNADAVFASLYDFELALTTGTLGVTVADVRRELRGRNCACWCPLPGPGEPDHCHGAILLRIAQETDTQ